MTGETTLTLIGNLTADPELRYTTSGTPMVSFTVASTPRSVDRTTGQWTDDEPVFLRCTAWRALAEHTAASLTRGTRVLVIGRLRQRSFTTAEGEQRTVVEIEVDEVGPSLRYATALVTKATSRATTDAGAGGGEPV